MTKETKILEGLHYSILEKWVTNGKVDTLPEGMDEYLNHLTAVIGWFNQSLNQTQIIKRLRATFQIDYKTAKNRWIDALNFFSLDNDLKYEAYMKIYAHKLDKISDLITQAATCPEDYKIAITAIEKAAKIRKEVIPKEVIPEEFFQKPNKLYTIRISDLGIQEEVNRNELAKMIDSMILEESEKERLHQEIGTKPRKLFSDNEQENEN